LRRHFLDCFLFYFQPALLSPAASERFIDIKSADSEALHHASRSFIFAVFFLAAAPPPFRQPMARVFFLSFRFIFHKEAPRHYAAVFAPPPPALRLRHYAIA